MALRRIPHQTLPALIKDFLPREAEEESAREVIRRVQKARVRGYLTRAELLMICRWKSARVIGQIRRNQPDDVRNITRQAFACRAELERIETLLELRGVGVPMASSILMLTDRGRYGVIDIRVWQILHAMKVVAGNERGVGLTPKHWVMYLDVLRSHARRLGVTPREVQRALFHAHFHFQKGLLYG